MNTQQQSSQPGKQHLMTPKPVSIYDNYCAAGKLKDKTVLITGGDSGIGRAVAFHCAAEGAKVMFSYFDEDRDAQTTKDEILSRWQTPVESLKIDLSCSKNCEQLVKKCIDAFGTIDILINNIAIQYTSESITDIDQDQIQKIFSTNFFSYFFMSKYALSHLKKGSSIINTASVTAYRGSDHLLDYSATKGAIISFTRSLAKQLKKSQIRVNAVAPGPVWTPLIPASFSKEEIAEFGKDTLTGKPAQPADIAPCYIFLAGQDSVFITGQTLHPNGGDIINT